MKKLTALIVLSLAFLANAGDTDLNEIEKLKGEIAELKNRISELEKQLIAKEAKIKAEQAKPAPQPVKAAEKPTAVAAVKVEPPAPAAECKKSADEVQNVFMELRKESQDPWMQGIKKARTAFVTPVQEGGKESVRKRNARPYVKYLKGFQNLKGKDDKLLKSKLDDLKNDDVELYNMVVEDMKKELK